MKWRGSEEEFFRKVVRGDREAGALLYDRFGEQVNLTLWRLLGGDPDHDDLVNEVFLSILANIRRVRDPAKLRGWILTVTVNAVRGELRKRSLRRRFFADTRPQGPAMTETQDPEARAVLAQTFAVLDRMPTTLRVVFALRYIDGHPLQDIADCCGCSLATVKRQLVRAEKHFSKLARREPALAERLQRGGRWSVP